ncbi:MAG: 2,3-bisphosphoglycerate-independent phosphoglycerate mutase [Parvibaculum sp.]|uniref:2,3-bisphosphoglycerate-independent phosphoglycerate mutase n=1 Tax=Parvibaculum sp. TaxID=2024848 RepID=UPI0025F04CEE|nr:2,3-bisphosphoglycerate-independent phosphoglycerate mutase [Parvibaculum sp.]MCE9648438.1 2,3-bisphosphoglycerate-independent phosphoglycerate mutase [Parvibaculum sp.]
MTGIIGVRPLVLVLLDGWGIRAEREANALAQARTPVYDRLAGTYPNAVLAASGEAVGLAAGKPGNVQAGYMTLGAGRPVEQDILRVNHSIQDSGPRGLATNPTLQKLIQRVRPLGGAVHLIGTVSPGGVAGNQHHLAVLAAMLSHEGLQVWIHGVMDGIDAGAQAGIAHLAELMDDISGAEHVSIGSLMGRAYAFDEGGDASLVKTAWKALVEADAPRAEYPSAHLDKCYSKGVLDDRIPPVLSQNYRGIRRDDAVFLVNLRPDLGASLMQELLESEAGALLSSAVSLTALDGDGLDWVEPLFARQHIPLTLSETLSRAGRTQLLLTETVVEKNLSLFLRGGVSRIYEGETLALAETPPLAKMEKRPELAAADLTIEALNAIKSAERDLLVVNFANVALLGRTGNMRATIEAAEAIDKYLGKIAAQVEKRGGVLAVTSAFGKGELMNDPETGAVWRGPTRSNMPFTLMTPGPRMPLRFGALADVAPTILDLLGVPVPDMMTGETLIAAPDRPGPAPAPAGSERTTSVPA